MKIACYLNQFFAGVGSEDAAQMKPEKTEGAVGSARGLGFEVAYTLACGDDYFGEHTIDATAELLSMLLEDPPDVLVCGPAFGAGRYGFACGTIAAAASARGIPAVTGMHDENPGIGPAGCRPYIVPTSDTAAGMREALPVMSRLAVRIANGSVGSSEEEGYRGRHGIGSFVDETAADRAVNLLLAKLAGRTTTEIFPQQPKLPPAAPLPAAGEAIIALVTEAACVPGGNPDGLPRHGADHWYRYPVGDGSLDGFTSVHGGFDTSAATADPRRLVPADAARALEASGRIGRLHDTFFCTTGNSTPVGTARRMAMEMAKEMTEAGVLAAILTST